MAKIKQNYEINIECIGCDTCTTIAPENFIMNENNTYAYMRKQPETLYENKQCIMSLKKCPVNAIEVIK